MCTTRSLLSTPLTVLTGLFIVNETFRLNLTENAIFEPACIGGTSGIVHGGDGDNSTVTDPHAPFYSSTTPQIFAIATVTVISYFLVILIFITPRTFFVGGPGGGAGFLTRTGLSGSSSVIGVGRRPLLQKIAAITVALSMTIATADTFKVAKAQYEEGFMNSEKLVTEVIGRLEIRLAQVISDTFLWLAQVQTLIRLFPRHKEKVTIKWLGFALILLDVIFSCLNNFLVTGKTPRPLKSRDTIPALSYLFELAIGFIYASCIIYYSISKYRFAFYHAKMRNICLVALLSVTSILIPVVFFVIDVAWPDIAAWGFYIRWVGAAAASVVVWEWVERVEALERDEKKDGILGREIYDGDEMLDATAAYGSDWRWRRSSGHRDDGDDSRNRLKSRKSWGAKGGPLRSRMPFPTRKKRIDDPISDPKVMEPTVNSDLSRTAPPAAVATPVSRADTDSTVYAVHYHDQPTASPRIHGVDLHEPRASKEISNGSISNQVVTEGHGQESRESKLVQRHGYTQRNPTSRPVWTAVRNPFKRKRASPPAEVAGAQRLNENSIDRSSATLAKPERWNVKFKIDTFSTAQRDKLRTRRQGGKVNDPLPVTIIPAQPRGMRTLSPDDIAEVGVPSDVLIHNRGERPSRIVQSSRRGQSMNVADVPAPIPRQVTWSPEEAHQPQELQLSSAADSVRPRHYVETSDRARPTDDNRSVSKAQQDEEPEKSSEDLHPQVDSEHDFHSLRHYDHAAGTLDQRSNLSGQLQDTTCLPTGIAIRSDGREPDITSSSSSSSEKRQNRLSCSPRLSNDDRALSDEGQMATEKSNRAHGRRG